jgi:hypothetical protein
VIVYGSPEGVRTLLGAGGVVMLGLLGWHEQRNEGRT